MPASKTMTLTATAIVTGSIGARPKSRLVIERAVKEYTRANMSNDASLVEKELQAFRKDNKVVPATLEPK